MSPRIRLNSRQTKNPLFRKGLVCSFLMFTAIKTDEILKNIFNFQSIPGIE